MQEYIDRLKEYFERQKVRTGRRPGYHIFTMGCQMNARDSEKISGVLEKAGFTEMPDENADFILFNTCTVRENANEKLYGHLGQVKGIVREHPGTVVAICGCMMQEKEEAEKIRRSYPFVSLVFGTHNLWKFPELFYRALTERKRIFEIPDSSAILSDSLPSRRKYFFKSGVNIMYGCNNFCSYCIVPYVRGREISREPGDILSEVRQLSEEGVKEVMLLGQNVNSYGKTLEHPVAFSELLGRVSETEKLERIRFMTSHPKDLSDDLIRVMAKDEKICRHLHLPLQSGSTEILRRMNRHYTAEDYLRLTDRIKNAMPDIGLTTDIIVGFPGETEEDFEGTLSVVREVGFQSAFTFIYSKRSGTPAAVMPDQVSPEVISDRFQRLLDLVQELAAENTEKNLGKTLSVLVEEEDRDLEGFLTGRLGNNLMVHFRGGKDLIGSIVNVKLEESRGFYYMGTQVQH